MTYAEAFDVIDAGEGRWSVRLRQPRCLVGEVWRTGAGFLLWDSNQRQAGTFPSMTDALRTLWSLERQQAVL